MKHQNKYVEIFIKMTKKKKNILQETAPTSLHFSVPIKKKPKYQKKKKPKQPP